MFRFYIIILFGIYISVNLFNVKAAVPDRTILFIIDGLSVETVDKIPLTNFQKFAGHGCYYKVVQVPLAAHPKDKKVYPHTCSVPNPVMMTGTVLFKPGDLMIQDMFQEKKTAFVTNSKSYLSISKGFDIYHVIDQNPPSDDTPVVEKAKEIIESENPVFMRVHLQGPGRGGYDGSVDMNKDKSWYRNIWHSGSLYSRRMKKADRLLGEFVAWFESTGRMDKTVMIVTSDNGQTVTGGHPPYEPGSSTTSMLIFGLGIKEGCVFDYAEIIDIAPTIAHLHKISPPNNFKGRLLLESMVGSGKETIPPDRYMERLNKALLEQHELSDAVQELPYTVEEIAKWHERFRDLKTLVEYSEKISSGMKIIANAGVTTPVFSQPSGSYTQEFLLNLSCFTDNVIIRYTTDGSEPTEYATIYKEPIKIQKTTTIKAKAFKQDVGSSYIAIGEYIISSP